MASVYFESSVFLAILAREPRAEKVRDLLRELKADKIRIYTSVLTVQEASVSSFLHNSVFADPHTKISKMARVKGVSRDVALTAARYEAAIINEARKAKAKGKGSRDHKIEDNKRRKFDCFHLATALALNCSVFYTFDKQFKKRAEQFELSMRVLEPAASNPRLPLIGLTPPPSS